MKYYYNKKYERDETTMLNLEKLQGEVISDKLLKRWEENIELKLIEYDFNYPYDSEIYKKIANTFIGEERKISTRKVNKIIEIDYINNLSWHELQLLRGGCDRFTAMVNLYNQYACKNNIKQIVNIDLLKERIEILREQKYYKEIEYIEKFIIVQTKYVYTKLYNSCIN